MGSRRKARILAFQTIFSWEFIPTKNSENIFILLDEETEKNYTEEILLFANLLIKGTSENKTQIDNIIKENLKNWNFERLSKVDVAILRMSIYSLLYQKDIPPSVTIDEAILLSKKFGNIDSYKFINGILDVVKNKFVGNKGND